MAATMTVAEQERKAELKDIKDLMDTAHGRKMMFRILKTSGCLDRPAIFTDSGVISYNEGKRSIGFDFMADVMDIASKKFMVMILEAKERSETLKTQLEREQEVMSGDE